MVNYLKLLIACLLVGAESRTIDSSNLIDAMVKASGKLQASKDESALFASKDTSDPSNFVSVSRELAERSSRIGTEDSSQLIGTQGFDLEKLLTEAASRIGNVKDYDERAVQWVKQLKLMLELISSDASSEKSKRIDGRRNDIGDMGKTSVTGNRRIISIDGKNWLDDLLDYLDEQDIEAQSSEENESHVKSRYEGSSTAFTLTDENLEEDDEDKSNRQSAEELDNMLVGVQNEIGLIRRYFEKLCSKHHAISSPAAHSGDHHHERSSNIGQAKKISKF